MPPGVPMGISMANILTKRKKRKQKQKTHVFLSALFDKQCELYDKKSMMQLLSASFIHLVSDENTQVGTKCPTEEGSRGPPTSTKRAKAEIRRDSVKFPMSISWSENTTPRT